MDRIPFQTKFSDLHSKMSGSWSLILDQVLSQVQAPDQVLGQVLDSVPVLVLVRPGRGPGTHF